MKPWKDSVAVITGAASGIGYGLAKAALERGAKVAIADIRKEAAEKAALELSELGDVIAVETDVTQFDQVSALADIAVEKFGKVNFLFNNAGAYISGVSWEFTAEQYEWIINLNQYSVIHGIRAFVPRMIAQGDRCHVTTISSIAGLRGFPNMATYTMTKHAVLALSDALYCDLTAQGILNVGVTAVTAGTFKTNLLHWQATDNDAVNAQHVDSTNNKAADEFHAFVRKEADNGRPVSELASEVFAAMDRRDIHVSPNGMQEHTVAMNRLIAEGRITGKNPYEAILKGDLTW